MIKNIKKINKLKTIVLMLFSFSIIIIVVILNHFSFAQQRQPIPICIAPDRLITVPGVWQSNIILFTSTSPGSLSYSDLYYNKNNSNYGNILTASSTWLFLNKGLAFQDLTKTRNNDYNKFIISIPTSTNKLTFLYNDVVTNTSRTIMTISTSATLTIFGDIEAKRFCFRADNGDLSCLNSFRPAVVSFYRFIIGHEYWDDNLFNKIDDSDTASNVSFADPYKRDSDYPYPYLNLSDIIRRIGTDPNDQYATKWFPLAYGYRQPYTNRPTALFIEEGDNLNPLWRYVKEFPDLDPDDGNDVWLYCYYKATNSPAIYISQNFDICNNARNNNRAIYYIYASSGAPARGYVNLQIRLEPAWQRDVCTKRDYLNSMIVASWGNPRVINTRIGNFRYPNLNNDPCVDNNRRPNFHSLIMSRFIVIPHPTTSTTSRDYIEPTSIEDFVNNVNIDFNVVIKSIGVAELVNY